MFFFELCGDHRVLRVLTHSFPTRRSSDLHAVPQGAGKHVGIERQGDGGEAHRPNTPKTQRQNRASSKAALASSCGIPLSCSCDSVVSGLNTSSTKISASRISMLSRLERPACRSHDESGMMRSLWTGTRFSWP